MCEHAINLGAIDPSAWRLASAFAAKQPNNGLWRSDVSTSRQAHGSDRRSRPSLVVRGQGRGRHARFAVWVSATAPTAVGPRYAPGPSRPPGRSFGRVNRFRQGACRRVRSALGPSGPCRDIRAPARRSGVNKAPCHIGVPPPIRFPERHVPASHPLGISIVATIYSVNGVNNHRDFRVKTSDRFNPAFG
jgi:hypothetical protein